MFRRITRIALAVLTLVLAVTAVSPAISSAAQNQGGGTGNSDYCSTLLSRLKRYHDIATDPREPKAVRDFYKARAEVLLITARDAGCSWAPAALAGTTISADTTRALSAAPAPGACDAGCRQKRTRFTRLSPARGSRPVALRRAAAPGGGTSVPQPQSTVSALKAHPTGNTQQDEYCSGVAKLIAEAEAEGDAALLRGDRAEADAWYALADYFLDQSTQNGCRFVFALKASAVVDASQQVVASKN